MESSMDIIRRCAGSLETSREVKDYGYDERLWTQGYRWWPLGPLDHTGHDLHNPVSGALFRGCTSGAHAHCATCICCVWPTKHDDIMAFKAAVLVEKAAVDAEIAANGEAFLRDCQGK